MLQIIKIKYYALRKYFHFKITSILEVLYIYEFL